MISRCLAASAAFICLFISFSFAAPNEKKFYTPEEIAAESKRANDFLDKCFDENLARHPQLASSLGVKINYDKWEDLSDASNAEDLSI